MSKKVQEGGSCYNHVDACFRKIECSNEFDDLFEVCAVPINDETFDPRCLQEAYSRSQRPELIGLFDCFEKECSMLTAGKADTVTEVLQTDEEFKKEYERMQVHRSNWVVEGLRDCATKALTASDKCWLLSKQCDDDCLEGIKEFQNCKEFIDGGFINKARTCAQALEIENKLASEIRDCVIAICFEVKKDDL